MTHHTRGFRTQLHHLHRDHSLGSSRRTSVHDDDGFTLIELLVVILILPIVVGALAFGLIAIFSLQGTTVHRISDSGDAQVVSANYVPDVTGALRITTDPTTTQCGSGTQLLGLESDYSATTNSYSDVITYAEVETGSTYELVRDFCANGPSAKPSSVRTISLDITKNELPPTISPSGTNVAASQGWISTQTVTSVTFPVTEPLSNYSYTLTAIPAASAPPSTAGSPITASTATSCGFAATNNGTVQNGTYAQTLCLVDFSAFIASSGGPCQVMTAAIPGGYVLSFCVGVTGDGGIYADTLPTWPGGFMGNIIGGQPFYTAIGCPAGTAATDEVDGTLEPTPSCIKPALYMATEGGTSTIDVTNISLRTATGAPATGWEFVTADAETTDPGEFLIWQSNKDLTLIPNTPTSNEGDACDKPSTSNPNDPGPGGTLLTGLGTTQVQCESTWQSSGAEPRTGTVMLGAAQPTSMTVQMQGAGLEGISLGVLLP
jgi:prepilin-type N-terminal cleavage/methylation domain-containing protein